MKNENISLEQALEMVGQFSGESDDIVISLEKEDFEDFAKSGELVKIELNQDDLENHPNFDTSNLDLSEKICMFTSAEEVDLQTVHQWQILISTDETKFGLKTGNSTKLTYFFNKKN